MHHALHSFVIASKHKSSFPPAHPTLGNRYNYTGFTPVSYAAHSNQPSHTNCLSLLLGSAGKTACTRISSPSNTFILVFLKAPPHTAPWGDYISGKRGAVMQSWVTATFSYHSTADRAVSLTTASPVCQKTDRLPQGGGRHTLRPRYRLWNGGLFWEGIMRKLLSHLLLTQTQEMRTINIFLH